jgi:hypothetical protein
MNETFKIRENGFDEIKKQLIIKSALFLLIAMSFAVVILFFNAKDKQELFDTLPFLLPIFLFSICYGTFKGLKRQKKLFQSYNLIFSENKVVREQFNTPTINIPFGEIKSISKDKKGGYAIKGKTAVETILIPAQIENYENLEVLFDQIKPIENFQQPTFDEKYRIPMMLLTMVSMVVVFVSFNKILVGVCCLIVSGLLIRSFIQIIKDKNMDSKTKRVGYYSLLVLVSVIAVTIMKITAF